MGKDPGVRAKNLHILFGLRGEKKGVIRISLVMLI